MNKEYRLPINMYIILEHASPVIYSSNTLQNNHFVILIDSIYLKSTAQIFKNEVHFAKSVLIESSSIDTLEYTKHTKEFELFFKNSRILTFYIFYFYKLKLKVTLVCYNNNNPLESIDLIYKNANWLEREVSEMFNVYFINKRDSRKLLLDYTLDINPMLKDYPTEGEFDCYYSHLENQVVLEHFDAVEL